MRFEIGDLVKYTHLDGDMVVIEWLGVVVYVEHPSIKVHWENGNTASWMNAAWLEKL